MRTGTEFMKSPRILIVEDEEPIRSGLKNLFVYHGFQVTDVADGEAGLSEAQNNQFDMVILDVMCVNGFESIQKNYQLLC